MRTTRARATQTALPCCFERHLLHDFGTNVDVETPAVRCALNQGTGVWISAQRTTRRVRFLVLLEWRPLAHDSRSALTGRIPRSVLNIVSEKLICACSKLGDCVRNRAAHPSSDNNRRFPMPPTLPTSGRAM